MLHFSAERVAAICRLQEASSRGSQASEILEIIDRALDLALSDKRAADDTENLVRNVLSDARRTKRRAETNARKVAARRPLADALHRRVTVSEATGRRHVELVTTENPEIRMIGLEVLHDLRHFATTLGKHGPACLAGLALGEKVADTAKRVGVSVATVERARRALREYLSAKLVNVS
ncbi:hypothetical protein [Streptomyces sp. enrichment culture]|uniref:hypothetical protein n=1 Tax=Streptomyces sp. enrichment culture TaxID=1795815 RepID=UPI003F54E4C9